MARPRKSAIEELAEIKSPYGLLANNIIIQAISDWENLLTEVLYETKQTNFTELRIFFRDGWCDALLAGTELTGEYILRELEDMKEAADYGMKPSTWRKLRRGGNNVKARRPRRLHSFR